MQLGPHVLAELELEKHCDEDLNGRHDGAAEWKPPRLLMPNPK